MRRTALFALVACAAGCGGTSPPRLVEQPTRATTYAGTPVSPVRRAPAIALHDAWGRPVSLAGQRGRYVLVTFLYTHCPDVCPLIAQNLNTALRALGKDAAGVRVLAVSVDPKGDTVAAVRAYRARMHLLPEFRYLIGTRAQLRRVWLRWNVIAVADKAELVDHVAYTALVDPSGQERVLYGAQVHAADVVHDLRALMRTTQPT